MTPKEKAKELFDLYLNVGMGDGWAKECALIAVDKVEKEVIRLFGNYPNISDYYREVKQEIEKL
jgi:hypothetical protein